MTEPVMLQDSPEQPYGTRFAQVVNNAAERVVNTLDVSTGEFKNNEGKHCFGHLLLAAIGVGTLTENGDLHMDYTSSNKKEVAAHILFDALQLYGLACKEVETPLDFDVIEVMIDQLEHLEHLKLMK